MTTIYIGGVYEYQAGASTTYYAGQGGLVALRRSGYASDNGLFYILNDHLGSTSVLLNQDGTVAKREFYYPYGGNRGTAFSDLTTRRFTGQYHEQALPGGEGLAYYNARWYDPQLGRFISADTLIPDHKNPQALNRYAYTYNNPIHLVDPTGHEPCSTGAWGDCFPGSKASTNPYRGERRRAIVRHGKALKGNKSLTSLEKFARLTEYAARFYGDRGRYTPQDYDNYMHDLSFAITGWNRTTWVGTQQVAKVPKAPKEQWLGFDTFSSFSGWRPAYNDYDPAQGVIQNNQMFHAWFYTYVTYYNGSIIADLGNRVHESRLFGSRSNRPGSGGESQEDFDLGVAGVQLGQLMQASQYVAARGVQPGDPRLGFMMLTPATMGQWLRDNYGVQTSPY